MAHMVTIQPSGQILQAEDGQNLLKLLRDAGMAPDAPCGGHGSCGKCGASVEGETVLCCQTAVTRDMTVELLHTGDTTRILTSGCEIQPVMNPWRKGGLIAFDIGTTTVVCHLLRERDGSVAASADALNPQSVFGADVISRIQCALKGEMEAQTAAIRNTMEELIRRVCAQAGIASEEVGVVSVVGNSCMQQLFLGILPENLAAVPFAPVLTEAKVLEAGPYLPCCPNAALLVVPDISGYVGADTVGCVLATGMQEQQTLTLMVDIGTNGEMVMGSRERMAACSTAAGPALEGARIRFGMRGAAGAIDHVWVENGELRLSVIGGGKARGICGSGLIDAVAVLLEVGMLNRRGRFRVSPEVPHWAERLKQQDGQTVFYLTRDVYLTQEDIREVQMAKGAIAAGIELMAEYLDISLEQIQRVLLAGAFGSFIRPESACRIDMLPACLLDKISAVGNAAGSGARLLACDREALAEAERLTKRIEFLELATMANFRRSFAKNMGFRE